MFTIWRTGHYINEEVSKALCIGTRFEIKHTDLLPFEKLPRAAVAYGILRGTADAFKSSKAHGLDFIEVDKGYIGASHFDGYYRISLNDMQAKYKKLDLPNDRVRKLKITLQPEKKDGRYILICPPTQYVEEYYGLEPDKWLSDTINEVKKYTSRRIKIRPKLGANIPLQDELAECYCVIAYNSTVAIDAVIAGVPVIVSEHSVLHDWSLNSISCIENDLVMNDREELLRFISYHQFTLDEIKNNKAFEIAYSLQKYGELNA